MVDVPNLAGERDWIEIRLIQHIIGCKSFVSGDPEGERLRVRYFRRQDDQTILGRVWFGPESEGPPGYVHGGALAAILDEAMGGAVWVAGHPALSVRLTTQNYRPMPLHTVATFEAKVERVSGRKIYTKGHIYRDDGHTYCEGEALYVELDREQYGEEIADIEARVRSEKG
jgi:acyl-coenzyme A thioesterase PaaI-like protein